MDTIKAFWDSFDDAVRKGLCIALSIVMLFSTGYITGALTNMSRTVEAPETTTQAPAVQVDATTTTTAAPATTTTAAPETTTTAPAPETTTAAPSDAPETTTAAPSAGTMSTEEIITLFNDSANKIKTTAKRATRNYQDMKINSLEVPSALQALADGAIEKFVKPNMTPEVYEGTEAVKEKYPVSGTDFASKLKAEYVDTITCTDNGTEYVIDIKLKDQLNPVYRSGEGVGSIFWTMNIDDIANNAPGFQSAELSYYNCTATAKIDKATGNMTYSKFNYNFDMDITIKMLGTLNAKAALTVIEEYVIEY
ncbi:MAG: hypothetical protein E7538_09750 [Ruminococcaceae bacterium]|nr:hypothetical protein [Oscillospiraceae bacterium]